MALKIYYRNEINKDVIKGVNRIASQYDFFCPNNPFDYFIDSNLYNFNKRYIENIKPFIHETNRTIKEHDINYIKNFIKEAKLNMQDERLIFEGNNWVLTTNRDYSYNKKSGNKFPIITLNALLTDKDNQNVDTLENAIDIKQTFEILALSSLYKIENQTLYLGCFDTLLKEDTTYKLYRKFIKKNYIKELHGDMTFIDRKMFYDTNFTINPSFLLTLLDKYNIDVEEKTYDYEQLIKR